MKRDRESFWHRHKKGARECPLASLSKGAIYFLKLVITVNQKTVLSLQRFYQTHSHDIHFKIMGLELTIERPYQTPSHNTHFKMTGLFRRFLRRRKMSSSRIHCCHIIIGIEFKGKHILEKGELFCCAITSSGLIYPFLLLENFRPLSPPWEPQTPFSTLGTPESLSTCLGIDSLILVL